MRRVVFAHSVLSRPRAQDSAQRDRVAAKNGLESYAFNIKNTVDDEKLKDKISPEDKATITSKCEEVLKWLDMNQVCCVLLICRISILVKFIFLFRFSFASSGGLLNAFE